MQIMVPPSHQLYGSLFAFYIPLAAMVTCYVLTIKLLNNQVGKEYYCSFLCQKNFLINRLFCTIYDS